MVERIFDAKVENLQDVLAFVDEQLEGRNCSIKIQMQIDIAIEELFVNVAQYAYLEGSGRVKISLKWLEDPLRLSITFTDRGIPYDPLAKPDPDVTLPARDRQIGGLGIYMVKKSMDHMYYEYKDGKNHISIIKKLRPA